MRRNYTYRAGWFTLAVLLSGLLVVPVYCWAQTPAFDTAVVQGHVQTNIINEISGMVASRQHENVLWVHNDSGDSARVFALNPDGRIYAVCSLAGTSATDWEDISTAMDPVDGDHYLYMGDIGDNYALRSEISVYRVPEPDIDTHVFNAVTNLTGVERYRFVYPDGARDAEVLMVDPWTGDIYILSKRDATNRIYYAPYPHDTTGVTTLTYLDEMNITLSVAGDISPAGYQILIKQYHAINYYSRGPGESITSALTNTPVTVPYTIEPQGEAVAWQPRSLGYYTASEGVGVPIYFYASQDTDEDGLPDAVEVAWQTDMAIADTDCDGMADGQEVLAGTSPTNRTSVFQLADITYSNQVLYFEWNAVTGRTYELQYAQGVVSNESTFVPVVSNIVVSYDHTIQTNIVLPDEMGIYRLQVRNPDF